MTFEALPPAVRIRVVALTADVLPDVVRLPAPLRRVAAFAPARRARLGATAIGAALDADEEFRERVATQVAAKVSDAPDEPGERAALVWLTRSAGWEQAFEDAVQALADLPEVVAQETSGTERLRRRVESAEQSLRELKALHRSQLDELKSENASLRRKLGEARSAARAARTELEEVARADDEARARAEAQVAAQDKELRRLRAQVAQHDARASAGRRATRSGRDEATVRARLLLDTVLEAAAGLQRELGLPSVTGAPGDRVESGLEDARGAGPPAARSVGPAQLEQHLALPRARLIVDGYNVSKTAWPSSSLEAQRSRLVNALAPLVARSGVETTVVFDAAASSVRPVVGAPRGVKVIFSPEGVIADDVIRDLVAAEPEGRVVVVVTSDRALVDDVARAGARTAAAESLAALVARSS